MRDMLQGDWLIVLIVGGVFLALGLVAILWGKREEKNYFNSIATRSDDMREFMEHWPQRPQPAALKIGGWIAITIGVIMLVVGFIIWI